MEEAFKSYTLLQPLHSQPLRRAFLAHIFDFDLEYDLVQVQAVDDASETFFSRYETLCSLAVNKRRRIENVTHWELLSVTSETKKTSEPREVLMQSLLEERKAQGQEDGNGEWEVAGLLDLAASTWLMLSIGHLPGVVSYDEPIMWRSEDCLDVDVIQTQFPTKFESTDRVKLPQTFTAEQLERIGGIEVRWTANLADHLLLRDDDSKVMLFHPVSVLELHKRSDASILPRALVEETLRTIALLIPPMLGEPNPWFQAECRRNKIDAMAGVCARLNSSQRQIDRFVYWRDRLVLLKRTFDDAEPRNLSQLWHDDRKKTQWFTFWVAVLVFAMTIFFGVVQSVAGIVQAWASVRALKSP